MQNADRSRICYFLYHIVAVVCLRETVKTHYESRTAYTGTIYVHTASTQHRRSSRRIPSRRRAPIRPSVPRRLTDCWKTDDPRTDLDESTNTTHVHDVVDVYMDRRKGLTERVLHSSTTNRPTCLHPPRDNFLTPSVGWCGVGRRVYSFRQHSSDPVQTASDGCYQLQR